MKTNSLQRSVRASLFGHLFVCLAIGAFGMMGGLSACAHRSPEIVMMTAITMESSLDTPNGVQPMPSPPDSPSVQDLEPPPLPDKQPDPDPPPPKPTPEVEPQPTTTAQRTTTTTRPRVKPNTNLTHRATTTSTAQNKPTNKNPAPPGRTLTQEEIRKFLGNAQPIGDSKNGATAGGSKGVTTGSTSQPGNTTNPSEDAQAQAAIYRAFYGAWIRPSYSERGNNVVIMEIEVSEFGIVRGRRMVSFSGSPAMDDSVKRAADAVRKIPNLPQSYARQNPKINVQFSLEEQRK